MTLFVDARIPVAFASADSAGADDALLLDGDQNLPTRGMPAERLQRQLAATHTADCACCLPRGAIGRQLAALFIARARGTTGFFRRVIVVTSDPATQVAVREAVAQDPLASACFRMVEPA